MRYLIIALLALNSFPAFAQDEIISDRSVGFIYKGIDEATLEKYYKVTRRVYDPGEGMFECASQIMKGTNKEAFILWNDESSTSIGGYDDTLSYEDNLPILDKKCAAKPKFTSLNYVHISGQATGWRTKTGLKIGMSLREAESLNEAPISIENCGCDLQGWVTSWHKGKLAKEMKNISVRFSLSHEIDSPTVPINSATLDNALKKDMVVEIMNVDLVAILPR